MAKKPKPTLLQEAHVAYVELHRIYSNFPDTRCLTRKDDVTYIERLLAAEATLRSVITGRKEKPYVPNKKWLSKPPETEA